MAEKFSEKLSSCDLCPHQCGTDRKRGLVGKCGSTSTVMVSSVAPHFGEEPPLVGTKGSGTIFFTNCNLKCLFCQNYDISQLGRGRPVSVEDLAAMMLELQELGCHNVNLVTPTHYVPQIVSALAAASRKGLSIPIVYNSGGYESVETIRMLEGIIDIYMPDIKYGDDDAGALYSSAPRYFEVARSAVREMQRQVGALEVDEDGVAVRGLIIRHLVLPGTVASSSNVLRFIRDELGTDSYVNIMGQYRPCYLAGKDPSLSSKPSRDDIHLVTSEARSLGLWRGF